MRRGGEVAFVGVIFLRGKWLKPWRNEEERIYKTVEIYELLYRSIIK